MRSLRRIGGLIPLCVLLSALAGAGPAEPTYVRKASRVDTILATLKASGLPTLEGAWYYIGPFDNTDNQGQGAVYPPEKAIDRKAVYPGKSGSVRWRTVKPIR